MKRSRDLLLAAAWIIGLVAGGAAASLTRAASGGIEKTEYLRVTIEPGPEPDVTFFATGEAQGKIEPCG